MFCDLCLSGQWGLLEMCGRKALGWARDVTSFALAVSAGRAGWVARVVGVPPAVAVLACFPCSDRCGDNELQDVVPGSGRGL